MKGALSLVEGAYANPTPAGVFYAISSDEPDISRRLILSLVCKSFESPLDAQSLLAWSGSDDLKRGMQILYRLQRLDFVRGSKHPGRGPRDGTLEGLMPPLLAQFSSAGNALLADGNGFYVASHGFTHEISEHLAAMAVDIFKVSRRYRKVLKSKLNEGGEAFGIVAPDGRTNIGFWPMHIHGNTFFLVVEGVPHLNQLSFFDMVQLLAVRYQNVQV